MVKNGDDFGLYMQVRGPDAVFNAIERDEITLVLMQKEVDYPHIRSICEEKNIPIEEGSNTDLWRMSAEPGFDVLGLKRRKPVASLDELCASGGTIWILDGVEYATNIGNCLRTAEVSGAAGVVITTSATNELRRTATRASMRADRFIPTIWATCAEVIESCKHHKIRIVVAEDVGSSKPWEVDLTGDIAMVVGAERYGVSQEMLEAADTVVRLPMLGFVPSYNLQVTLAAMALESLRQMDEKGLLDLED